MSIKIISTGSYSDGKILDNFMLSNFLDTSNEWIIERTGIEKRYIAEDLTTEELAYQSCKKALEKNKIDLNEKILLICSSITSDTTVPSSSFTLSGRLGIKDPVCFDINAACSGFIYALYMAKSLMQSGNFKYALVVGAERLSKYVDWEDRSSCILFGDGSGAVVLENTDYIKTGKEDGKSSSCEADDFYDKKLNLELVDSIIGGKYDEKRYLTMNSKKSIDELDYAIKMNGRQIYKFATDIGVKIIEDLLEKNKVKREDVALIVPHQSNLRIIETLASKSNIDLDKWFINLNKYGNTSSASVPLAMDEIIDKFDCKKNEGKYIMLIAFGGGLSYGGSLLKIN